MTSNIQTTTATPLADYRIWGMELHQLQAIGKLMQCHRPDTYADETLQLTPDDINSLGELVLFLAESRMTYDETTDRLNDKLMHQTIEQEQAKHKASKKKGKK